MTGDTSRGRGIMIIKTEDLEISMKTGGPCWNQIEDNGGMIFLPGGRRRVLSTKNPGQERQMSLRDTETQEDLEIFEAEAPVAEDGGEDFPKEEEVGEVVAVEVEGKVGVEDVIRIEARTGGVEAAATRTSRTGRSARDVSRPSQTLHSPAPWTKPGTH